MCKYCCALMENLNKQTCNARDMQKDKRISAIL